VHIVTTGSGVGRVEGAEIALLDTPYPDAGAVIEHAGSLAPLAKCAVRARIALDGARLSSPLSRPRAVWGVGLNYHSKAVRTGRGVPAAPILYLGAPSAVIAPNAAVCIPVHQTVEMDYEGEIAVVIGRRLYRATADEVWPCVAGITGANDMTARDVMRTTSAPTLAKSFPGFNPLGASLCTLDEFPDPDCISIRTWVNGELHQDDSSTGMIFPIPDLLARISWFAALEPGDIVLTGTPAGTGQDRQRFLAAGDEIRVEAGPVLPLVTTVVAPLGDEPARPVLTGYGS
jgi:2-keto-4-pentenoate hydratase/2-oxohepta-3-ene-1,7-dioic acid hydratase in catechol pathway